jgi:hypothetical protein
MQAGARSSYDHTAALKTPRAPVRQQERDEPAEGAKHCPEHRPYLLLTSRLPPDQKAHQTADEDPGNYYYIFHAYDSPSNPNTEATDRRPNRHGRRQRIRNP